MKMEAKPGIHLANLLQSCIEKKARSSGKILHAHILRLSLVHDTFLSNRLIELYSKCNIISYAQNVFDMMPNKDIYSWNAILSAHCKSGNLQEAYHLFDEMPERNTISWNNVISSLIRYGYKENALNVYNTMICEGFMPTHCTLASVLSACGALMDVECGRRCHGLAVKVGLDKNLYVSNALLSVYSKCKLSRDTVQVFADTDDPNEVTFTAMMGGLAQTDHFVEALDMFKLMCRKGIRIDSISLSSVLTVFARNISRRRSSGFFNDEDGSYRFSDNMHGEQIHSLIVKHGFETDLHLTNTLLDVYAKNGDMDSAESVFADMRCEVSVVSWNVMIAGYGGIHRSDKSIEFLERMVSFGFEPDDVTYINLLASCVKSGDIETGRRMFDMISSPSVVSWNAILSGYSVTGNIEESVKLFREMQIRNVHPDRTSLAIVLSSCVGTRYLKAGKEVHAVSIKSASLHADTYVASALIGMYSKCGNRETAERVFYNVPDSDTVCWNAMIAAFSLDSLDEKAFTLFKNMRNDGMFSTPFTYATILSCCANSCSSSSVQGRQIHAQIVKDGYANDVFVGSALINMYCKCGDVDDARTFFESMRVKNTVTWNEMIHGYAQNGRGEDGFHLYRNMIEYDDIKPDCVTFVAVLTACSHSGLVDVGIEIFNSMQKKHGIEPGLDHYTCVIDSLGRAGRFNEAEALVENMAFKDDCMVWEVLLSCCRVHGNVRLGKRAADELFRLDPQNPSPYLLLANTYSSLGLWDEARMVREAMSDRKVVKDPGSSWVEDNNQMIDFTING